MKKPERTVQMKILVSKEEKRRYQAAANELGVSLSTYIRWACDARAGLKLVLDKVGR